MDDTDITLLFRNKNIIKMQISCFPEIHMLCKINQVGLTRCAVDVELLSRQGQRRVSWGCAAWVSQTGLNNH